MNSKLFYKIKEVSEMLSIPISTLRFWESEFKQLDPTVMNKQRRYTSSDIEMIKSIHYLLRVKGLKIEAAKSELENRTKLTNKLSALERLEAMRSELDSIIKEFKQWGCL